MGERGPVKHLWLEKLDQARQRRDERKTPPIQERPRVRMPTSLDEHGIAFWRRHESFLVSNNLLTEETAQQFEDLCRIFSKVEQITRTLDKEGYCVTTRGGNFKRHPLVQVLISPRKFAAFES